MASRISLPRQIKLVIVASMALAVGVVGVIGFYAIERVDQLSLERQASFVAFSIGELQAQVVKDQESITIWDDAVSAVHIRDLSWIDENLGTWAVDYFGHSKALVLDHEGRAFYQTTETSYDGGPVPEAYAGPVATLAKALKALVAADTPAGTALTAETGSLGAEDVFLIDGHAAVISIKPIVPSSDRLTVASDEYAMHVSVTFLDQTVPRQVETEFHLDNVRFQAGASSISPQIPIVSKAGHSIGFVTWTPLMPGSQVLWEVGPPLLVMLLMGSFLLAILYIRLSRASARLEESEAHASHLAMHDSLTGLPNRAMLEKRLALELGRHQQGGGSLALAIVDIDRFKHVNDTLGHQAGDELIRQVAVRLKAAVGESNMVARLGGDEFAVVISDIAGRQAASRLCEQIVSSCALPYQLARAPVHASISAGAIVAEGELVSGLELVRCADLALYEAKRLGRGRFEFYADKLNDLVVQRHTIEADLRHSLETRTGLRVAYQPLYKSDGKTVIGAEALVRWDHPVHGPMGPDLFIGIAEERGLIGELGDFVLTQVCQTLAKTNLPWIAVNLSPVQLRDNALVERILDLIHEAGISSQRLQLEITEGVLLENAEAAQKTLQALRTQGIHIALDDFGTGYSSMSYLKDYNVDKLKIDRSFIRQVGSSNDANAIVMAMIGLAKALGLSVTAEGVETEIQRADLERMGCLELQGFMMSRPIPESELIARFPETAVRTRDQDVVSTVPSA